MEYRKKLIEVALPLEAINKESAHEKSVPRRGHPATMHLWWARRPLAACRAVIFASLVDDPSSHPERYPTEESQDTERRRLFEIIERLVKWENSNNADVLAQARAEIFNSTGEVQPPLIDPFCGGGTIPLEALRLGLEAHASDLNPIPVLIAKALIEIPAKFTGSAPVNPESLKSLSYSRSWHAANGLAEDVRYYGRFMRQEAERRLGEFYPKINLPKENGAKRATVMAWLWARVVTCPNPACGAKMPLVRSFWLSTKKGKKVWIDPVVSPDTKEVRFEINKGMGSPPEGTVGRSGAKCIVCNAPVPFDHIRAEGRAARMSAQMMAVVAEGDRERFYLEPSPEHESVAKRAVPSDAPDTDLPEQALGFRVQLYGMTKHRHLFTSRQLATLTTLSDLVADIREKVRIDAVSAGMPPNEAGIDEGGLGATAYADAVATYLCFAIDKLADWSSALCSWIHPIQGVRDTFARHAVSMVWDYVEINPFSNSVGNFWNHVQWVADGIDGIPEHKVPGKARQLDATVLGAGRVPPIISTDPPYYDNVPYADLSDFFYVWLRRSLGHIYPSLFSTLLVPKRQELVADPYRHGGREAAQKFFEEGLGQAFKRMKEIQNPGYPLTVFYAFKQSEADTDDEDSGKVAVASTGWETMLEGLIRAGFTINGTWPLRTERAGRVRDTGSNALASSIVLVCRPKQENAPLATRREFVAALKKEMPAALKHLLHGNVAPVDLAQATIGPGMAIFSRYAKVLEADGNSMSVRSALHTINEELDAYLTAQEGEMDRDTRFCTAWFEQFGMSDGPFGSADVLARAKNTSVQGLVDAGVVYSKGGKVRLLKREEYKDNWDPIADSRVIVWECTQHLIKRLNTGGEEEAAKLVNRLGGGRSEDARALAYRLFSLCEKNKWADEALAYNTLVVSWPAIQDKASQLSVMPSTQGAFQYE